MSLVLGVDSFPEIVLAAESDDHTLCVQLLGPSGNGVFAHSLGFVDVCKSHVKIIVKTGHIFAGRADGVDEDVSIDQ